MTKLLKTDFHYDRLFKKYETEYTVETVLMLMTRARKMYNAIEMILTVIKLIESLQTMEKQNISEVRAAKIKNLKVRIRCHIKSFVSQHTLFPV